MAAVSFAHTHSWLETHWVCGCTHACPSAHVQTRIQWEMLADAYHTENKHTIKIQIRKQARKHLNTNAQLARKASRVTWRVTTTKCIHVFKIWTDPDCCCCWTSPNAAARCHFLRRQRRSPVRLRAQEMTPGCAAAADPPQRPAWTQTRLPPIPSPARPPSPPGSASGTQKKQSNLISFTGGRSDGCVLGALKTEKFNLK